jgi:signal transduction histidine kinase
VASQINQVVMNLLTNAEQAITGRGTITVRTGVDADTVWIEVQDTGCGIAPDKQARIFEPFYTSKPVGQGTGLGLSISFGIVQRHGGSITVKSEHDVGSTFRVTLPISHVHAAEVAP